MYFNAQNLSHTHRNTHMCVQMHRNKTPIVVTFWDTQKTPIIVTFWDTQTGVAKSRRGSKRLAFSASEFLLKYANILLK